MLKPTLAALGLAITLAVVPASAQQSQPPTALPDADVVGLPVYSSDGQMLGQVTENVRDRRCALKWAPSSASAPASFLSMPTCFTRKLIASNSQ
jgi:hypothetical protein